MEPELIEDLRKLGQLRVSADFKARVLVSILSTQARKIKALESSGAPVAHYCIGLGGRRLQELRPAGFGPLPEHARAIVESFYRLNN